MSRQQLKGKAPAGSDVSRRPELITAADARMAAE
jgi:hypothetical protein